MGRKKERATKSRPKANPLLPVNLKCWPLLAEVGGVESGVPMAQVFVQMVRWKSRQKRATNGCEAGQKAVKSKAYNPLLLPWSWWWVARCARDKGFLRKWHVWRKAATLFSRHKSAPNGCEVAKKQRPTPCSNPPLLAADLVCL